MSKSSIIFCVLLLVCAAQSATVLSVVLSSIKDVQNQLKSNVESTVASIETAVGEAVTEWKSLLETLTKDAKTAIEELDSQAEAVISDVETKANSIVSQATTDLSTAGCLNIVDTLRDTAVSLGSEATTCVTNKMEDAYAYISDFLRETKLFVSNLNDIVTASSTCVSDTSTVTQAGTALVCVKDQLTAATLVSATSLAKMTKSIAKITIFVATLESDITACVAIESIKVLVTQASAVITDVQSCVDKLI